MIRSAKAQTFPELRTEIMEELKVHELLALLFASRSARPDPFLVSADTELVHLTRHLGETAEIRGLSQVGARVQGLDHGQRAHPARCREGHGTSGRPGSGVPPAETPPLAAIAGKALAGW